MKKYHLKILYPSNSDEYERQYYIDMLEAYNYIIENSSIIFLDEDGETISLYPANFTIIEKIEYI